MPYATRAEMLAKFGTAELVQLTDLEQPHTDAVVDAVLDRALVDASAEIDGYLVGRYPLPLSSTPELLRVFCCDVARYRLMTAQADEQAKVAYESAVRYLTMVAKGDINLLPPESVPAPAGVGPVLFSPGSKVMGREAVAGGFDE